MKNGKIPVSFSIVRKILYLIESASFSIFHGNALEEGKNVSFSVGVSNILSVTFRI